MSSNYEVVCTYVHDGTFKNMSVYSSKAKNAVQSLAAVQAMAETTAMPKMNADDRNSTYVNKYKAHGENLVNNNQDFFKEWPPKWLCINCFLTTDIAMTKLMKLDTDKNRENHWRKAKTIVAEIRRDYMPLYATIFNRGIPSGNQLLELLEKLRKAICRIHKVRKGNSIPIESDEVKDDDLSQSKEADQEEQKEDEAKEEQEEQEQQEQLVEVVESVEDAKFFPYVMIVFLLLGPLSPEPISFGTLGVDEIPEASPGGAAAVIAAGVDLSSAKLKDEGTKSRARAIRGSSPIDQLDLFEKTKKRNLDAMEESNEVGRRLVSTMERNVEIANRQAEVANLEKRIEIAEKLKKSAQEIAVLYQQLDNLLQTSTSTSTTTTIHADLDLNQHEW